MPPQPSQLFFAHLSPPPNPSTLNHSLVQLHKRLPAARTGCALLHLHEPFDYAFLMKGVRTGCGAKDYCVTFGVVAEAYGALVGNGSLVDCARLVTRYVAAALW